MVRPPPRRFTTPTTRFSAVATEVMSVNVKKIESRQRAIDAGIEDWEDLVAEADQATVIREERTAKIFLTAPGQVRIDLGPRTSKSLGQEGSSNHYQSGKFKNLQYTTATKRSLSNGEINCTLNWHITMETLWICCCGLKSSVGTAFEMKIWWTY